MLKLKISKQSVWDEVNERFITVPECELLLEHSLVAISEWESKWNKPFLSEEQKTDEEFKDYVKCMTLNRPIQDEVYTYLTYDKQKEINQYMESPMTATTIKDDSNKNNRREIITSEIIYYWMTSLQIPFECDKWHLNRLLTLIRVCGIKNSPEKKMSQNEVMARQKRINAARRSKHKK